MYKTIFYWDKTWLFYEKHLCYGSYFKTPKIQVYSQVVKFAGFFNEIIHRRDPAIVAEWLEQ